MVKDKGEHCSSFLTFFPAFKNSQYSTMLKNTPPPLDFDLHDERIMSVTWTMPGTFGAQQIFVEFTNK